jgi:PAS domain S-box-containing protein
MSELLDGDVFRSVMEDLPVGVYFTDRQRRIVFWNEGAERISGYLRHEVLGRCCRDNILLHCDHQRNVICGTCCPLAEALADGKPREASLFLRHKAGHRVPVRVHTVPIRDGAGTILGAAECFQRQRYLPHPERRDISGMEALSGIPEPGFMLSEVRARLGTFEERGISFAMVLLGVDHFEELRVSRGQEACATVLHVIASTMQNTIRPGDCLGAWSNGTLMLIVDSAAPDAVRRSAERMRALASCSGVVWWGDPVPVTLSGGGTKVKTGDTVDALIRRAEHGLAESVERGGDRVTVCEE